MNVSEELQCKTTEFTETLAACDDEATYCLETVETRFEGMKLFAQSFEKEWAGTIKELSAIHAWFRMATKPVLQRSRMIRRANVWPEGYPGDYITLEATYANEPEGEGLARHLDRYFLSRTLAVAVRSRLRKLAELLNHRATEETGSANWLNLACGSCRELLAVSVCENRVIHCVDSDQNALDYAKRLLSARGNETIHFHTENAFRLVNARRNIERFGEFTTIYSAGLFDYLNDETLCRLLTGLYGSLAKGGVLIAPLKDAARYETFDYHWVVKWDFFMQRNEMDFRRIFSAAGISNADLTIKRDESGVILFFAARR